MLRLNSTTDYERQERKWPSLHSRKLTYGIVPQFKYVTWYSWTRDELQESIKSQSQIFRYGWSIFLSATSAQFFRFLWFMPSSGVRSPWIVPCLLYKQPEKIYKAKSFCSCGSKLINIAEFKTCLWIPVLRISSNPIVT